ncbi:hypothetical protein EV356DRAFT_557966 [Viridothelium virens]|uniref:Dynactin subunit 4 n=1 Tax=Viridothelium virens TaxID=1048519 RepID=A0A6A6HGF7_VIRVR|nr:hypothetical protein EV356DRAFT_557966 [Viridothelium virens]
MALPFPYTYFACPCTETTSFSSTTDPYSTEPAGGAAEDEESTFHSQSPRANYALYPLEHLLYCEDCHQIRCPRCWVEEIMTWYCPSCLFEYANSMVKSDGNRCTRSCFNCPLCMSNLSIVGQNEETDKAQEGSHPLDKGQQATGPYFLHCPYCSWSSVEIGIQFDKGKEIYDQLQRIKNGGRVVMSQKDKEREQLKLRRQVSRGSISQFEEPETPKATEKESYPPDDRDLFANLNAFYKSQILESTGGSALGGAFGALSDYGISSPGTLSRIMSMYGSNLGPKRGKDKPAPMREAQSEMEGVRLTKDNDEEKIVESMQQMGWDATTSQEQRREHPDNMDATLVSDLRPVPTLLRTKRSKRCRTCRHILVRPEPKVASTRYKIRLLALNYIPSLRLRPLTAPAALGTGTPTSSVTASSIASSVSLDAIPPARSLSLLLTVHNPLFDPIKVTLATPSLTPPLRPNAPASRSRVTILCPQFEVGASGDVWDEALDVGAKESREKSIKDAAAALESNASGQKQAEAGKVWERGRNWTSVVLEVLPGVVNSPVPTARFAGEDANVLEIPLYVRIEYETETGPGEGASAVERAAGGIKERKEQRELEYWCVLGVGRIAQTA